MSYSFEKLVVDGQNPRKVEVVFRKPPEMMYGTEWPASRFVMPAEDIDKDGEMFVKLVKRPAPRAVDEARAALKGHFDALEARAQLPSVLDGRTARDIAPSEAAVSYSTGTVIPFPARRVA